MAFEAVLTRYVNIALAYDTTLLHSSPLLFLLSTLWLSYRLGHLTTSLPVQEGLFARTECLLTAFTNVIIGLLSEVATALSMQVHSAYTTGRRSEVRESND